MEEISGRLVGADPELVLEVSVRVVLAEFCDDFVASDDWAEAVVEACEESPVVESALVIELRFGRLFGWSWAAI